jgi:hypothetical protein
MIRRKETEILLQYYENRIVKLITDTKQHISEIHNAGYVLTIIDVTK